MGKEHETPKLTISITQHRQHRGRLFPHTVWINTITDKTLQSVGSSQIGITLIALCMSNHVVFFMPYTIVSCSFSTLNSCNHWRDGFIKIHASNKTGIWDFNPRNYVFKGKQLKYSKGNLKNLLKEL